MSSSKRDICVSVIRKKFGVDAANLTQLLLRKTSCSVVEMKKNLKIEKKKLRQLLVIFFKMGFIELAGENRFKLNQFKVLEQARKLLYLNFLKVRQGQTASSIGETLLLNGIMTFDECIQSTHEMSKISRKLKTM